MEFRNTLPLVRVALVAVVSGALGLATLQAGAENKASGAGLLPVNAQPGQCYAKVMIPAKYKSSEEKVVIVEAGEKIEIIPAKYEWTEVRVPLQQESEKLIAVPAVYETVEEKVLLEPARTVWRSGPGTKARDISDRDLATAQALGLAKTAKAGQCYNEFYKPAVFLL